MHQLYANIKLDTLNETLLRATLHHLKLIKQMFVHNCLLLPNTRMRARPAPFCVLFAAWVHRYFPCLGYQECTQVEPIQCFESAARLAPLCMHSRKNKLHQISPRSTVSASHIPSLPPTDQPLP